MARKSLSKICVNDPRSIIELSIRGKNDVIGYCMEKGLIANKYECPECGREMKFEEKKDSVDGFRWRCERSVQGKKHRVSRSVRAGSWFEGSKLGMDDILIIAYGWIEKYTNEQIARMAGVDKNTVTDWMSFCREVCVSACIDESTNLGGMGEIVEIEESMLGKCKYGKGKPVKGKLVFGGVQHESIECFFEVVSEISKEALLEIIKRRILPGTVVISDCWKTYNCLDDENYKTFSTNHNVTFKDLETGTHTNMIEGLWGRIKRNLRGKKQVSDTFDSYLAEFMWRKRHKNDPDELTDSFLKTILKLCPPRIKDDRTNKEKKNIEEDEDEEGYLLKPGPSCKKSKFEK